MANALLFPLLAHAGLAFALYAVLTWARYRAVARGVDRYDAYGQGDQDGDDPFARRVSANLRNQFEAPVLLYAGAAILIALDAAAWWAVALAWASFGGRVIHTSVQLFTTNVRLRGQVFAANFLAVVGLWVGIAGVAVGLV